MALAPYLDDCAYSAKLARFLRDSGHTVVVPSDCGLAGAEDRLHFETARANNLIVLTKNCSDFVEPHEYCLVTGANHPGIVGVYRDNDTSRDKSHQDIVRALSHLEQTLVREGRSLDNSFHVLNHWRVSRS
jgi:predicted nuclease of predicted toxin-antitoxin system